ncbi:mucin-17-like [Heterodontus francisci]|uniref:mucin-17-like n=1 Tax=Heterodontus francisci TaxID=7792 RepID=UPI00355C2FA6
MVVMSCRHHMWPEAAHQSRAGATRIGRWKPQFEQQSKIIDIVVAEGKKLRKCSKRLRTVNSAEHKNQCGIFFSSWFSAKGVNVMRPAESEMVTQYPSYSAHETQVVQITGLGSAAEVALALVICNNIAIIDGLLVMSFCTSTAPKPIHNQVDGLLKVEIENGAILKLVECFVSHDIDRHSCAYESIYVRAANAHCHTWLFASERTKCKIDKNYHVHVEGKLCNSKPIHSTGTNETPSTSSTGTTESPSTSSKGTTKTPSTSSTGTTETPSTSSTGTTETPSTSSTGTTETPSTSSTGTTESPSTSSKGTTKTPSTSSTGTTETPSTSSTGTTKTPSTSSTGTTETPSTSSTGTTETPSTSSTGTTETPSTSSTGTTETPSTSSTGTTETPSTSSTGTTETPSTSSTGTTETSSVGSTATTKPTPTTKSTADTSRPTSITPSTSPATTSPNATTTLVKTTATTIQTATPTTTRSNTTTTTATNPCQNGGIWDGKDCKCTDSYSGTYCEFVKDNIEIETVEATINASVKITNQLYSDKLKDNKSEEFKAFSDNFEEQMNIIYRGIEGYSGVRILSIRNGSIVVDHDVIITVSNSEFSPDFLTDTVKEIEKNLKNTTCTNSTGAAGNCTGFEFDKSHATVEEAVVTDDCASLVPKNLKQYYKLILTDNKAICASICNEARTDTLKCGNGKCGMTSNGPNCYCVMTGDYWYFGDFCNIKIHKNGLIGGLSTTVILLILGLLAFTVYLGWFRKDTKKFLRKREDEQSKIISEKWAEDDWAWHNPETITVDNREATGFDAPTGEGELYTNSMISMKPVLESIFTAEEVKIQRPQFNAYGSTSQL